MYHYTSNSLVQTKVNFDRSRCYPLTLKPPKNHFTRSPVSPASPSPTAAHVVPKSIPGSPSLLPTTALSTTNDATFTEIMAQSTHIHICSLPHLEESLERQWTQWVHDPTTAYITITYDKSFDLNIVLEHIDKLAFRKSLRLWILSGRICIKMSSLVHDTCTTQFSQAVEDALKKLAASFGSEKHELFSTSPAIYRVAIGAKQPDNSWKPNKSPLKDGPWIVVKTGYSESKQALLVDAEWWAEHAYNLKLIVLIDIQRKTTKGVSSITGITFEFLFNVTGRISAMEEASMIAAEQRDEEEEGEGGEEEEEEEEDGEGDEEEDEEEEDGKEDEEEDGEGEERDEMEGEQDDEEGGEQNEEVEGEEDEDKPIFKTVGIYTVPGTGSVTQDLDLYTSWFYGFDEYRPDWLPLDYDRFTVPASELETLRDSVVEAHTVWNSGVYQRPQSKKRRSPNDRGIYHESVFDPSQGHMIGSSGRKSKRAR
ncbi:hypothetical protein VKT23_016231 [Stygiomarasmius scandens]|uniref:Uncharacterized protein n=1 Tax=Marasmiellus scandens TaxID=2682957 RepID=A0ABR1IVT9_9AGAR